MFIDVHVLATLDLRLGLKIPIEIEMVSTLISASSQLIPAHLLSSPHPQTQCLAANASAAHACDAALKVMTTIRLCLWSQAHQYH
jgi:hypothetical protein